jgi:hypothetical protein
MTIETKFYAVRDPETHDMTFWYRDINRGKRCF